MFLYPVCSSFIFFKNCFRKFSCSINFNKDGIGVFSSDSVFNALAQGKDLVVREVVLDELSGDSEMAPINVKFGNNF